jgi:hypothetical protein
MRLLHDQGARVQFHDPYNDEVRLDGGQAWKVTQLTPVALKRANACAVGQLYAYLQDHQTTPATPAGG